MTSQNGHYATPSEFLSRNRKDIELPSGLKVQIRKLTVFDVLEPRLGESAADASKRLKSGIQDEASQVEWLKRLVCKACVHPRVVLHEAADEHEVSASDLGEDLVTLFTEVQRFAFGGGGVAAAFFRAERGMESTGSDRPDVPAPAPQGPGMDADGSRVEPARDGAGEAGAGALHRGAGEGSEGG